MESDILTTPQVPLRRYRPLFVTAIVLFAAMPLLAVVVSFFTGLFNQKEPRIYGQIPSFELTERSGDTVSNYSLHGKVWAASFIFTNCSGQCPMLVQKVKTIQNKLRFKENFRLVSITVDPERDTPRVLKEYATRFQADPFKWLFLTGEKKQIQSLVENGFRLSSGVEGATEFGPLSHSFKVVLVDHVGRIRGYYDGLEDEGIRTLIKDARYLIRKAF